MTLNLSYPYAARVSDLDPAQVKNAVEANLLRALFSNIFDFDSNGELVLGLAAAYRWEGNDLHISIRKSARTIDGYAITAFDAAVSLRRLILKKSRTHGDLSLLFCEASEITNVREDCKGIRSTADELILSPSDPLKAKFVVPLLTSIDFVVIPSGSIDLDNPELPIRDFKNTSGAFYLEQDMKDGRFVFEGNAGHHYAGKMAPKRLVFYSAPKGSDSIQLFRDGKVDLLTTVDNSTRADRIALASSSSSVSIHRTVPINSIVLKFTEAGMTRLSRSQRIAVGNAVRNAYSSRLRAENGLWPATQFFPQFSEGALPKELLTTLDQDFKAIGAEVDFPLTIAVRKSVRTGLEQLLAPHLPQLKYLENPDLPSVLMFAAYYRAKNESPDFYLMDTDAGFFEDFSLVSYIFKLGLFGRNNERDRDWLESYLQSEDKQARIKMLRELHYEALSKATLIPIAHGEYIAVARAPWKMHFSRYFAGSPLWKAFIEAK